MTEFIKVNEKNKADWNEFVLNHKKGNFFQTYDYYNLFENEKNNKAFAFGLIENNKILGVIVGVLESNLFPPFNLLTRRAIIRGGPIVLNDDPEIIRTIISGFVKKMKHNCIYIQIRNLFDTDIYARVFEQTGFSYIPHLDILIDLEKDEQLIANEINSNKRGNIHKSINKGTTFKEIDDMAEVCKGIDLIHLTYKRVKLPVPDLHFFNNAYNLLSEKKMLRIFGAYAGDILIGVRFELCFNGIIYDWYA